MVVDRSSAFNNRVLKAFTTIFHCPIGRIGSDPRDLYPPCFISSIVLGKDEDLDICDLSRRALGDLYEEHELGNSVIAHGVTREQGKGVTLFDMLWRGDIEKIPLAVIVTGHCPPKNAIAMLYGNLFGAIFIISH